MVQMDRTYGAIVIAPMVQSNRTYGAIFKQPNTSKTRLSKVLNFGLPPDKSRGQLRLALWLYTSACRCR